MLRARLATAAVAIPLLLALIFSHRRGVALRGRVLAAIGVGRVRRHGLPGAARASAAARPSSEAP